MRVLGQSDLRVQAINTQVHSRLGLSLLAAKKHPKRFLAMDNSTTQMGSDTHLDKFETSKARAGELVTQSDEAFRIQILTS